MSSPFSQLRAYQRYMRWQGYQATPIEQFGGLDLRSAPDESAAIDVLNVDFDRRGRIRSRDGFAKFTAVAASAPYHSLSPFYTTGGTKQLLAAYGGASGKIDALNTSGAVVASQAYANSTYASFARFAAPGSEHAYVAASGTGAATVYRWDGSAWSTPTWTGTAPTGRHLTSWKTMLVNARRNGTSLGDNPSTVYFSDPNTPTTWSVFKDISPGDGEEIMALAIWGDSLFAFKQTKFEVFYGVGTDATGAADPQSRLISSQGLAGGAGGNAYRAIAISPSQGVFFANRRGIWRTTGSAPELISQAIDPIFQGGVDATGPLALNQGAIDQCAMVWHDEHLWFAYPPGSESTNDRLLRFNPQLNIWTLYDIPASSLASFRIGNAEELVFSFSGSQISLAVPSGLTSAGLYNTANTNPAVGTTRYYKVTATNASGETTPSAEFTATIPSKLAAPVLSVGTPGVGGFLSDGSWYAWKLVAYNGSGEFSSSSNLRSSLSSGAGNWNVTLSWGAVAGATGYRLYRHDYALVNPGSSRPDSDFGSEVIDVGNVTSYNDNGSIVVAGAIPTATPGALTLSWGAVTGATGYRLYRGTSAGGENAYFSSATTSVNDTGAAGTAASPPVTNTASTAGFDIGRHSSAYTLDGGDGLTTGTSITSRYRSGYIYQSGGSEGRIREAILHGTGAVTFQGSTTWGSLNTGESVTMGTAPAVAEGRARGSSFRGRNFSWQVSSTSAWTLERIVLMLAGARDQVEE